MKPEIHIEQNQINDFSQVGAAFMRDILDLDYDKVLVTDISDLSDFTHSGMPAKSVDRTATMKELTAAWDTWVVARVKDVYGIPLTTTVVNLVWLFNQIELAKKQPVH